MSEYKYSKAPKFGLCFDTETSGSTWGFTRQQQAEHYQCISFGAVVFNMETLQPVETLYVELKFDSTKYDWHDSAQKIHGLSREHLEANGVTAEEAACALAELILKYWGPDTEVPLLGHNRDFDEAFMRQLLEPFGIMPKLWHVHMDTSGIGQITLGVYRSNDLFHYLNITRQEPHNALSDAIATLEAAALIKGIMQSVLEG